MSRTAPDIDRDALWAKIRLGEPLVIVDALPPISYAASHLPGAINIPPPSVAERAQRRIPDLDVEIVVYCSNAGCHASLDVTEQLLALGYSNVRHYAGGKEQWTASGLPLEGGRA